jgi:hypothetical protein
VGFKYISLMATATTVIITTVMTGEPVVTGVVDIIPAVIVAGIAAGTTAVTVVATVVATVAVGGKIKNLQPPRKAGFPPAKLGLAVPRTGYPPQGSRLLRAFYFHCLPLHCPRASIAKIHQSE